MYVFSFTASSCPVERHQLYVFSFTASSCPVERHQMSLFDHCVQVTMTFIGTLLAVLVLSLIPTWTFIHSSPDCGPYVGFESPFKAIESKVDALLCCSWLTLMWLFGYELIIRVRVRGNNVADGAVGWLLTVLMALGQIVLFVG